MSRTEKLAMRSSASSYLRIVSFGPVVKFALTMLAFITASVVYEDAFSAHGPVFLE